MITKTYDYIYCENRKQVLCERKKNLLNLQVEAKIKRTKSVLNY